MSTLKNTDMKTKIFSSVIVLLVITTLFSCEDNFETVSKEVYKIVEIQRSGCFTYDFSDTLNVNPVLGSSLLMELVGDTCYLSYGSGDYLCLAKDSLSLVGNTLKTYLKSSEETNGCECSYVWNIKLVVNENKGLKILIYEFKNNKYELETEAYKIKF